MKSFSLSKNYLPLLVIVFTSWTCSRSNSQPAGTNLSAIDFAKRIAATPGAVIVDVRTAEEFAEGHLVNARNFNWNGSEFSTQVATLDKSQPVFVYCLSGGRSSAAAKSMRSHGFKEVYELSGGILKWRAASLQETTDNTVRSAGMTRAQFDSLSKSAPLVLVDFYADWCAPCKKMKPYLDEFTRDLSNRVTVLRVNYDENRALCTELGIDELPVLQLYKQGTSVWRNIGFIDKENVLNVLQKNY